MCVQVYVQIILANDYDTTRRARLDIGSTAATNNDGGMTLLLPLLLLNLPFVVAHVVDIDVET